MKSKNIIREANQVTLSTSITVAGESGDRRHRFLESMMSTYDGRGCICVVLVIGSDLVVVVYGDTFA
jgi:hypothetical protein